jgi:hypothetical protein
MFTGSVRLCNGGEISSSVVLIITIIIKRIRRGRFCNVVVVLTGVYCSWQIYTYVLTKPPVSTTPTLQNPPPLRFIIIVIIKPTDDEISPSLHNRIDPVNTDTLSDENLMLAGTGRNM